MRNIYYSLYKTLYDGAKRVSSYDWRERKGAHLACKRGLRRRVTFKVQKAPITIFPVYFIRKEGSMYFKIDKLIRTHEGKAQLGLCA